MSNEVGKRLARRTIEGRRSAAYRWLARHYDALQEQLTGSRPPWKAAAETAREDNVVIGPDGMRKAWKRLQADKASATAKAPTQAPDRARVEISTPKPFPTEAIRRDDDDDFQLHDVMGRPIK